ncbi:MAG: Rpn family recombination-promoting nuclease/putative transposase [Holosporales bacterium]|jgi:predicted transposase/invertase (TIGR01784 family)|nr:Rpn family recombination-promoting nuclease/putative transposase [Holosporales bacterium]
MVTTLLDPKLDYIFKNIFGVKKYEHLLISFLNALLKGNPLIKKLVLTNTEFPKIFKDDKACRLDVRATSNDDTEIDIEIQIKNTGEIPERACHYIANMVPGTIGANQSYKAARVIGIWILGENVINGPDAISEADMTFQPTAHVPYRIMADTMRIIFVEREKFNAKDADAQDLLTAWLSFLKDPLLLDEVFFKIKEVKDAMDRLKYISSDKEVRANADLRLRTLNDRNSEITVATEKGITIGKKESATRMLKKNISLNDIFEFTGLSVEEIKSLKK